MGERGHSSEPESTGHEPEESSSPEWSEDGLHYDVDPLVEDPVERARVFKSLFPKTEAKAIKVGRFELLRRLGRGGMGEVYVAYDEQLDRNVALKLLLRDRSTDRRARERLLREAQVLARLSHPNVVQIHEAGVHEGQVFLAMELVEGITLRQWLALRPEGAPARPWGEVLSVMIEAGRGLAAAHAAGITHRDFKPDNVLVGHDGRVRVVDFGLARSGIETSDASPSEELVSTTAEHDAGSSSQAGSGSRRSIARLTEPGVVAGTLVYMSPEQLAAMPIDERADQWSFCVTLFEALYGERPWNGSTRFVQMVMLQQGGRTPIANASTVPRWLRTVVDRGLSFAPDERFESMEALLHELERRRGRVRMAGLLAAALVGSVGAGSVLTSTDPTPCRIDETTLGDAWSPARREELRAAFGAVAAASEESRVKVEQRLDDWSEAWVGSLRSSCEATRIVGSQSTALLDLRGSCLERQRREATAITERLTSPEAVGLAFELLEDLPDVEVCEDPRLEQTMHPVTTDPHGREAIMEAFEQLTRAKLYLHSGRIEEASELARPLERTIRGLEYLPLTLGFRWLEADRLRARGDLDSATALLRTSIREAEIAGLDELSATLRTQLAEMVVGRSGPLPQQQTMLEEAETAVDRIGRSYDRRRARLARARAAWIEDTGDHRGALAQYRSIIEDARARGDFAQMGRAQQGQGGVLLSLERYDDAQNAFIEARASYVEAYGPGSLGELYIELELGLLELARGQFDAARARLAAVRESLGSLLPPRSPRLRKLDLAEAKLAFVRGDLEEAERGFARVAELDVTDITHAEAWLNLGVIRFYQSNTSGSLDAYRRAKRAYLQVLGDDHPYIGMTDSNIGESLAASGDLEGALVAFGAALRNFEVSRSPDHLDFAMAYKGRAQVFLELGRTEDARRDLEHALSLHERNPSEPVERADVEHGLARALWSIGDRTRALELARGARDRLLELGHEPMAAPIVDWLDEHE